MSLDHLRLLGLGMHRTRLAVAGLLAAIVLLASLPGSFVGAEGDFAEVVSSLPSVPPSDAWLGLVQGIQAPDLAFQAGARWDRVIFPWSLIQKNGPKSWEQMYFSDAAIRAQVERGVTMVGLIIYTPQWASTNPTYGRPIDRPQGLNLAYNDQRNTWGQFVRQLAIRQRGVVDNWIIWNEPDVFDPKVRYTWDGSYEEYFQLLKTAYLNIKEVNPQARVILGGLSYWWDKKYARTSYLESLLQVIERDPDNRRNGAYFDAVTLHVYNAPLNSYAVPLITRQTLEAHGLTKPIWIDESNAVPFGDPASPLPYSPMAATLDQQAAYVIQSTALALAAGVERYAIYKAVDEKPENGSDLYGLVRNDHSLKPAYLAYQVAAAYFQDVQSATYSWPGSAEVPTPAEVQSILDSADSHPQFIWPAQVSQVVLDRGPHLTTVLWNNSPFDVTHSVSANARQATLVTRSGATETITARGGFYKVELPGSRHNPDKSDYSIYMIGGDPFILDEQVAPLPSGRVRSRIEKVWPHESAPVETATKVNITAQLLLPGPAADPVPCRYKPEQVQLWRRLNGGPPELVANGVRRLVEEPGLRYPVWDFNDVNVERARAPESSYEFYILVDGLQTDRESWIYGGPESTDWTQPPVRPPDSCE
jgi:hypothetical protein